jgi:hypothetical protein
MVEVVICYLAFRNVQRLSGLINFNLALAHGRIQIVILYSNTPHAAALQPVIDVQLSHRV